MPIYEFVCRRCNQQFEALVRGTEKPVCPSCGSKRLGKLISLPVAHTAGSTQPPCPARDAGACDLPNCRDGSCALGGLE